MKKISQLPTPAKCFPIVGHILNFIPQDCIYKKLSEFKNALGDKYTLQLFHQKWVVISNRSEFAEVIVEKRDSFIKGSALNELKYINNSQSTILDADKQEWKKWRKTLSPFFMEKNFNNLDSICTKQLEAISEYFNEQIIIDDMEEFMSKLALSVASKLLFGYDLDITKDSKLYEDQKFIMIQLYKRMQTGPFYKYFPTTDNFKVKRVVREGHKFMMDFINESRLNPTSDHLLGQLVQLEGLTDHQIVNQIYGIIGASLESSGSTLSWFFDFIARNQDLQEELVNDLKLNGIESKLLEQCLYETMRIRPAFPILVREADVDSSIGDTSIPKGTFVSLLLGDILTNEEVWGANSNEFHPKRFENLTTEQKKSFTPFSTGTRTCIGKDMALVEMKTIINRTLKLYQVSPSTATPTPYLKFVYGTKEPLKMEFSRRS